MKRKSLIAKGYHLFTEPSNLTCPPKLYHFFRSDLAAMREATYADQTVPDWSHGDQSGLRIKRPYCDSNVKADALSATLGGADPN